MHGVSHLSPDDMPPPPPPTHHGVRQLISQHPLAYQSRHASMESIGYQMTDNMDLLTPPPIPPPHSRSLMSVSGRVSHGDKKMQIMHRP